MTSWLFSLALFLVSTMTSKAGWRDAFRYWHSNTTFAIVAECQKWCDKNEREWRKKCTWDTCESCSPCSGLCWSLLSIHTKVPRSESTPRLPFSLVLFDCVADLTSNASSVAVMELRRRAESTTAPFLTHLGTHTRTRIPAPTRSRSRYCTYPFSHWTSFSETVCFCTEKMLKNARDISFHTAQFCLIFHARKHPHGTGTYSHRHAHNRTRSIVRMDTRKAQVLIFLGRKLPPGPGRG